MTDKFAPKDFINDQDRLDGHQALAMLAMATKPYSRHSTWVEMAQKILHGLRKQETAR